MHGPWEGSLRPLGPPAMPPTAKPWWDVLPLDFHARQEPFEVPFAKRPAVAGCAVIDRGVCAATATALFPFFSALAREKHARRQLERLRFYADPAFLADPSRFFLRPGPTRVARRAAGAGLLGPKGARAEDLSFESAFEPRNPALRDAYLAHTKNRTAHARHVFHGDRPRLTVVVLHGFWASPYWMNAALFELPWLYRLGFDVVFPTMPFHGVRRMEGAFFSGHGFVSPELGQSSEAMAHAVWDARVIMDHLRERGVPAIGITGMSLGGYLTALLASIDPSLAFAIPNVPVASMVDLLLAWGPLAKLLRRTLRLAGIGIQDARRLLAVHHALSYRPALPKERLMVIAGVGDRMAPPSHARLLWEHWGQPTAYYFPGNHALHLDRGGYLRVMAKFLARQGLVEADAA